MRVCKQCGEMKPNEQFRPYYGNRKGRYKTCKVCESVNNRYKYLKRLCETSIKQRADLLKIEALYQIQRDRGLQPPGEEAVGLNLDELIERQQRPDAPKAHFDTLPVELQEWLERDLDGFTEEELDDITDVLTKKYRPIIRVDATTYEPVYNDTYREVLKDIIKRFDDYIDALEAP